MLRVIITIVIIILILAWCPLGVAHARLTVMVSIVPQQQIVQQIGGDLVEVKVMVPPGATPHVYEPKPQQMTMMAQAKLYFATGVAFERVSQ